jgi:hypothetical protein
MNNILLDILFGDELHQSMSLKEAVDILIKRDLINIGELAELAISKHSGVALCDKNTPDIDLVTGKQIKHALVRKPLSSDTYLANIGIRTTADILCVITNPVIKEQYFLHIPYKAFRHLSGNAIAISFGKDGYPRSSQWWKYEVSSFDELCKIAKR